jgi:hypothetical protein
MNIANISTTKLKSEVDAALVTPRTDRIHDGSLAQSQLWIRAAPDAWITSMAYGL